MRNRAQHSAFGRSRGFTLAEMAVVIMIIVAMIAVFALWQSDQKRMQLQSQQTDLTAREFAQIDKAVRRHLDAAAATAYAVGTTTMLPISSLITEGNLPTNFAVRGAASQTAYGQPYVIAVRRLVAGEKPTAVVAESGSPVADKLAQMGIENLDAPIATFKRDVASQSASSHKVIAATIGKGTRAATGVGQSYTKDLTDYFTSAFTQTSAAALINFKDLEPDGDTGNPLAEDEPTYSSCRAMQGQLIAGATSFYNTCSSHSGPGGTDTGYRIVGEPNMEVCGGHGTITVLPFGGTLTSGLRRNESWIQFPNLCPGHWDSSNERCQEPEYEEWGVITMNSVTIDSKQCGYGRYESCGFNCSMFRRYSIQQAGYNVCCHVGVGSP